MTVCASRPRGPARARGAPELAACAWAAVGAAGCAGELALLAVVFASAGAAAWLMATNERRRALGQAQTMRLALERGQPRELEFALRRELALAAAGEAVSPERQWLARTQLAGILVAEWRFHEAREVYGADDSTASPLLRALATFGRHELAVLSQAPDAPRIEAIRRDRARSLELVPPELRGRVEVVWDCLLGLALVRSGQVDAGAALLEAGVDASLAFAPTRVVYLYHLGHALELLGRHDAARARYEAAALAFPGTRLASEARARSLALGAGEGGFRRMLPEPAGLAEPARAPEPGPGAPPSGRDDDCG